ncbi:MAG: phosphate ABC transporter substrate-binding protein PstS [Phycisphaerales bacterium]
MSKVLKMVAVATALTATTAMAEVRLQGAGASFPAPFYQRLVSEYQKLHPGVAIDYQSIGSGGGIKAITGKTVHFAGSDAPLNKKQMEGVGGAAAIIEIPSCAGGVVPLYNLPGVKEDLKFTGALLADIYMGKIVKWNDPAIAKLNPGVNLPDQVITPVWRTDGSGTTYVWTNYLATQSDEFKNTIGMSTQVRWPFGQGGKGNEGVTAVVKQTVGGLGYVEQGYADNNHLPYGAVANKDGKFLKASPEYVSMAGAGAVSDMEGNILAVDIWNQPGDKAYPIASFTYLIVYKNLSNLPGKAEAQALVDFLWWATHDGQKYAEGLYYAPLAPAVQKKVEAALKMLTYNGESLKFPG